jgi:hypothetical protein
LPAANRVRSAALGGLLIDEGRARRGLSLLAAASAARERLGFPARPVETGRIAGWVAAGREYLGEQAQPAWERGAGLSVREAARWPAGDGDRIGGLRSAGRVSPSPSSLAKP